MAGDLIRPQQTYGVDYPDGYNKGVVSTGRHSLFGVLNIGIHGKLYAVGGMQAFSVEEINNTQFRAQAGNDWLEPVFGMRMWQGEGSRFQLRGADLQELIWRGYVGGDKKAQPVADIDFRFMPFIWQYNFTYTSPLGTVKVESASWSWMTVWITRYSWALQDPMSLISESFSFIGKGYNRYDLNSEYKMANWNQLWGAGSFTPDTAGAPNGNTGSQGTGPALQATGFAGQLLNVASQPSVQIPYGDGTGQGFSGQLLGAGG